MSCCNNTYDLGCFESCENISKTGVTVSQTGVFTVRLLPGLTDIAQFERTNGQLLLVPNLFNEDGISQFQIINPDDTVFTYTTDGVTYNCFQIRNSISSNPELIPVGGDCEAATYRNSDGTFEQEIASGGIYTAPDIEVTDSDGTTFEQPANTNVECSACPDGEAVNSDDTYSVSVPSGGSAAIADTPVTVKDGQGNTLASEDLPSGVAGEIVVSPALTRSLLFNGTSDYLEADNVEALFLSAPVTLSFWLKPPTDKGGTSQYVFTAAEQASENNRFILVFGGNVGGANQVLYISAGNRAAAYVDAVNSYANVWTHFVVVCTGSTWQLYVNGSLVSLTALTATSSPYGDFCDTFSTGEKDYWRWMSRPRVTGFAEGYLDEVSMWDKVLTLAEVGELRDGTAPANLQQHSAVDNMFAWWGNGDFWRDAVDGSLGRNRANRIYDKGADGYSLTPAASMTSANISTEVPT